MARSVRAPWFAHRPEPRGRRGDLGMRHRDFSQTVVATDHKVLVGKCGVMAGQTFGGNGLSI
jgi:hypothetical protein